MNNNTDSSTKQNQGAIDNVKDFTFLRDEANKGNANAIALWALCILEFDLPSTDEFISLIDKDDGQWLWIGELACTLVKHLHDKANNSNILVTYIDEEGKSNVYGSINDELWYVIIKAEIWFKSDPLNQKSDFYQNGKINFNDYKELFTEEFVGISIFRDDSGFRPLDNTISVLHELASDFSEAQYLLGISENITDNMTVRWLKKAAAGTLPIRQLAAYYLGSMPNLADTSEGIHYLRKVRFPSEDDLNYDFLTKLALKAKARLCSRSYLQGQNENMIKSNFEERFYLWSRVATEVASQWETVDRCTNRLQNIVDQLEYKRQDAMSGESKALPNSFESIELPEHIRSLTLETGRLAEALLKWCLFKWQIDANKLPGARKIDQWEYPYLLTVVGSILGNGEDGNTIDLDTLVDMADLKIDKIPKVPERLTLNKPYKVWHCTTNFSTLVIANAVAARSDDDHPFRHIKKDSLIETLNVFGASYNVRNENSHYSGPKIATTYNEAIFWANAVRMMVDQFLVQCVPLIDKKARR